MRLAFICWLACSFPNAFYAPHIETRMFMGRVYVRCSNGGKVVSQNRNTVRCDGAQ